MESKNQLTAHVAPMFRHTQNYGLELHKPFKEGYNPFKYKLKFVLSNSFPTDYKRVRKFPNPAHLRNSVFLMQAKTNQYYNFLLSTV